MLDTNYDELRQLASWVTAYKCNFNAESCDHRSVSIQNCRLQLLYLYSFFITLDWKMKPQWTRIRNKLFVYEETLFYNLRRKKRLLHKKLSAHFYDSLHPRLPLTSAASTQSLATIVSYPYRIAQLLFARLQILHSSSSVTLAPPLQV